MSRRRSALFSSFSPSASAILVPELLQDCHFQPPAARALSPMGGRSLYSSLAHTRIVKRLDLWILSCFLLQGPLIVLSLFAFLIHCAGTVGWVSHAPFSKVWSSGILPLMSFMKAPITGVATRSSFRCHSTLILLRQCTNTLFHTGKRPATNQIRCVCPFQGFSRRIVLRRRWRRVFVISPSETRVSVGTHGKDV